MKIYTKDNLPPHRVKHSISGMSWGRSGHPFGRQDLARSIIYAVIGEELADRHYRDFSSEFVDEWSLCWSITADEVIAWVTRKEEVYQEYLKSGKCVTCKCRLNLDFKCSNKCPEIDFVLADGIKIDGQEGDTITSRNGGGFDYGKKIPHSCDMVVVCGNKGGGYVPISVCMPHQLYSLGVQKMINEGEWEAIYVLPFVAKESVLVACRDKYSKERWDK